MTQDLPPKGMSLDEPFPLKSRFRRRFVPALLGFVGVFLIIIGLTTNSVVESIYLELAQKRAQTIARAVAEDAQDAWKSLLSGKAINKLDQQGDDRTLTEAFATEARQLNLPELKVYDLNRRVLYATYAEEIGTKEDGRALRSVIKSSRSGIVTKTLSDGTQQYELYVPVFDNEGNLRAVFELYEPVGYLNAILIQAAVPIVAIPGLLFIMFALALNRLVSRAQMDINARTDAINELRERIESFVSSTAVEAAKGANPDTGIKSQKMTTTLFFSDIRDFTGFAEQNSPEAVVNFLNRIMTLQVDILKRHGGDVDKMIGDAVLARFDGNDSSDRAVLAAREIQFAIGDSDFPRALGIGIYRGQVISGAVGPKDRRDFTVIGDAVNIAARLCSAAASGEIVVAAEMAKNDFEPAESIQVKGRREPVVVRRLRISVP